MAQPLTKGNMVVFKGDKRASGKEQVAISAVNQFLAENKNNKAIYVSYSSNTAKQM